MKKLLAIILAFAMLFAFASCGDKPEDETTTTTTDIFADIEEETTEVTEAVEETSVISSQTEQTEVTDEATTVAEESTTAASKGLNSTDIAEIVAYYNAVRKATNPAPAGNSSMKLVGEISGDGTIGTLLEILSPIVESALSRNSTPTDYIPANGHADIKVSDVTKATAVSKDGVTTVTMRFKSQVDDSSGDPHDGGAVARGIGTLGNIDIALKELNAELGAGRETVKLTYDDAYLKCTIDEKTGMITGGTWHHQVHVSLGEVKGNIGVISATLKNITAVVDYSVVI